MMKENFYTIRNSIRMYNNIKPTQKQMTLDDYGLVI